MMSSVARESNGRLQPRLGRGRWIAVAVAAGGLALGAAACSSGGGGSASGTSGNGSSATTAPPAPSAPSTAAPSTPAPSTAAPPTTAPAPAAPSTAAPSGSSSSGSDSIPNYQPSTVVSQASGHVQLTSPDSVDKVGSFYSDALSHGGWTVTSHSQSAYSANFVAKRGNQGATVAVTPAGASGTSISISTYPT
jgi:hypothetical protein